MRQLLVLRNVALNDGVSDLNDLSSLSRGALAITLDGRYLYTGSEEAGDLADFKNVRFVGGLVNDTVKGTVQIPRRAVTNVNKQVYVSGQVPIMKIGGTGAPLTFLESGSVEIMVKNLSYNHVVASQSIAVSVYKKANESNEAFIDKIVDALNGEGNTLGAANVQKFFTAAKVGTEDADFGITLTALNEHVDFSVSMDGMFELNSVVQSQEPVLSIGKGEDIARIEKDVAGHDGDSNYEKLTELWFNQPLETDPSVNYVLYTIEWDATHDLPQQKQNAASNILQLAVPTGATARITAIDTAMGLLFGSAFDATDGAEAGAGGQTSTTDGDPTT